LALKASGLENEAEEGAGELGEVIMRVEGCDDEAASGVLAEAAGVMARAGGGSETGGVCLRRLLGSSVGDALRFKGPSGGVRRSFQGAEFKYSRFMSSTEVEGGCCRTEVGKIRALPVAGRWHIAACICDEG
jgi:hypothetical protein